MNDDPMDLVVPEEEEMDEEQHAQTLHQMEFVQQKTETFLEMIQSGFIRLMGEYGENALICMQGHEMAQNIMQEVQVEQEIGEERLLMHREVLDDMIGRFSHARAMADFRLTNPGRVGQTAADQRTLSVNLAYSELLELYTQAPELGGTGWRNINEDGGHESPPPPEATEPE